MMYFDKDGLAITMQSWAILMESDSYRILKQEESQDGSWVVTNWLGLDLSRGVGKKKIFETLAYFGKNTDDILTQRRYATKVEALRGHSEIVLDLNSRPRHYLRKLEP